MTPCRVCSKPAFGTDGYCSGCRPASYPNAPGYSNGHTSKEAAERIAPHVSKLAEKVLAHIRHTPRTAWEIEQLSDMRAQTITARIRELTLKGMIEDSGKRGVTGSGRSAVIWRMVPTRLDDMRG